MAPPRSLVPLAAALHRRLSSSFVVVPRPLTPPLPVQLWWPVTVKALAADWKLTFTPAPKATKQKGAARRPRA